MQLEDLKRVSDELNGEVLGKQSMNLIGREADDFKIQITGLVTERQVSDTAADQPDFSTPATDCIFNTTQDLQEGWIFQAKTGQHLDHRFTEERRGFFR
jgi:hypothetical protein